MINEICLSRVLAAIRGKNTTQKIGKQCRYHAKFFLLLCLFFAAHLYLGTGIARASNKNIVLIAGMKSHGPGDHEYLKSIKLLKVLLDRAPNVRGVTTHLYFNGWPDDPGVLDRADTIVIVSDGEGGFGPNSAHAPFMTDERMQTIERQIRRGCGFMTFHFSTFSPAKYAPQILSWNGGYFDWHSGSGEGGIVVMKEGVPQLNNQGPLQQWHSAIRYMDTDVVLATPRHPISEGVSESFRLNDEYYYRLAFRQDDPPAEPILSVPALSTNATDGVVAWALQRKDGGWGFGTTTGHYFENWKNDNYRKLILNAVLWTARAAVPKGGVDSTYLTDTEVDKALLERPIPTLYVPNFSQTEQSGRQSAEILAAVINSEAPRFRVEMAKNTTAATRDLHRYRLLMVNNCSAIRSMFDPAAGDGISRFLRLGGGVVIVSTADGSDPGTTSPAGTKSAQYERICKEIRWEAEQQEGNTGLDPTEPVYSIELPQKDHSITRSLEAYQVKRFEVLGNLAPRLSFILQDQEHIQVLAAARSENVERPLAFIVRNEKARIYQVVVGRDLRSALNSPYLARFVRNGSLWAAGE